MHALALAAALALLIAAAFVLTRGAHEREGRSPWRWARHRGAATFTWIAGGVRAIGPKVAIAIALSAGAISTFADVAEEVSEHRLLTVDVRIREFASSLRSPLLDRVFHAVTWLGESAVLTGIVAFGALLLAWRRNVRVALVAVVGPLLASIAIVAIKRFMRRDRPTSELALDLTTYSFPSGHATASTASLLTLAYVLAREGLLPWWSVPTAAGAALLIGGSRVYLDVHWASDVAGGWAVGAGLALAGVAFYEQLRRWEKRRRRAEEARTASEHDEAEHDVPASS